MLQSATITSLPEAFEIVKEMNLFSGEEVDGDYRAPAREALLQILRDRMVTAVDRRLAEMARRGEADRRNGGYRRWLLTELGAIELEVPRTRTFSAMKAVHAYARRAPHVDRMILSCFVLGLSTRKVAEALLPVLGELVSATTVSRVARTLDGAVEAFHKRPLQDRYRALVLDGVVLSRKTGAGAVRRPVLVALGILPDGKKEVIDFRLAASESAAEWEGFLTDLSRRGLTGERLELICVDGGKGCLAALSTVYPGKPVQRCWAHKTRNITDKVKKKDRETVKKGLQKIYKAKDVVKARSAARRFADRWEGAYPKAVACLRADLDELLNFFRFKKTKWRKAVRTTNAIERRFREVKRRTRPMGVFSDKTSMERILFAVFIHENKNQEVNTPFSLTQNS